MCFRPADMSAKFQITCPTCGEMINPVNGATKVTCPACSTVLEMASAPLAGAPAAPPIPGAPKLPREPGVSGV